MAFPKNHFKQIKQIRHSLSLFLNIGGNVQNVWGRIPSLKSFFAGSLAVIVAAPVLAQSFNDAAVNGVEHWVQNGDTKIYLWEKYTGSPEHKPVVVLAHGSATAGKESFDLQVHSNPDISLMDVLARQGFDVIALDTRGFGRSTHPVGHFTTAEAASDLNATVDFVMKLRNVTKVNLLGWSWGTQYAGIFVMAHPEKVEKYISYAQMGPDSVDIAKRKQNINLYRDKVYIQIPEAAWHGRFYSLTPKNVNFPEVVDAYAKAAALVEINTPTSPQLDLVTLLPMLNPKLITVPTMLIHGEFDDVADTKQLLPFFDQIPNPNKRYVIVPNGGHMMMFQQGYSIFQRTVIDYFKSSF